MSGSQHLTWPPQAQVHLGDLEAIVGAHQHIQALTGQGIGTAIDQQAVGGGRPTADPAAQLMQLGQSETFGVVDHHHAGLGHIHAHFHHRGGHEHLAAAIGKVPQHRLLIRAVQAAVQQTDRQLREHLRSQFSVNLNS